MFSFGILVYGSSIYISHSSIRSCLKNSSFLSVFCVAVFGKALLRPTVDFSHFFTFFNFLSFCDFLLLTEQQLSVKYWVDFYENIHFYVVLISSFFQFKVPWNSWFFPFWGSIVSQNPKISQDICQFKLKFTINNNCFLIFSLVFLLF